MKLDGEPVGARAEELVVYAVNKPAGVVSTASDPQRRPTVVSLVRRPQRLYPVGRLDADTTGLILLTNDGDLAHRLTHPSFEVDKTYRGGCRGGPVHERTLRALRNGIPLEDGMTAPARVTRVKPRHARDHDSRGPQAPDQAHVRDVGHRVIELQRVRFGPLLLGDLRPGRIGAERNEMSLLRSRWIRSPKSGDRDRRVAAPDLLW